AEAAGPMLSYWSSIEKAWRIDLEVEAGDGEPFLPAPWSAVDEPPADWQDPWMASADRLGRKRDGCEELFDCLRAAEAALAEAALIAKDRAGEAWAEAVRGEEAEYRIAGALLELDCARLSAYHEAALGDRRTARDLAYLAESTMDALLAALALSPDRRARREGAFLIFLFYGLRLRLMKREASGKPVARAAGRTATFLELALRAARVAGVWEPRRRASGGKSAGAKESSWS
ncbi:MAG TPA: hypothetical protein VFL04_03160, partial [Rectinemataceae bacterium]|nr:hypothetical protein [Rectinemataceae bacterium]